MKKIILTLGLAISTILSVQAQAPQAFNYQGIARTTEGIAMANKPLKLKLSVIDGTEQGTIVYTETQEVTTNQFGLYTLHIGEGTPVLGNFASIPWQLKNKYIKVELDANDGNGLVDLGTTQLLSVPYALYAEKSGNADNAVTQDQISRAGTANYLSKFDATGSSANTINSQVFDNGTSVGIGTNAPDASTKLQINRTGNGGYIRMVNTDPTGIGTFRLINDNPANFATFSKYGSAAVGGYPGISTLYPFANILGYGNNGPFLNAGTGNIGFAVTTGGTNKLKIHIDAATLRVGLGGNSVPEQLVHINSTDAGVDANLKITSNNSGHTAADGFEIRQNSSSNVRLTNMENAAVIIGTNNADRVTVSSGGDVGIGINAPAAKLHINSNSSEALRIDGASPMYSSIFENGLYRGYFGSYSGNPEDVDFGTGGGSSGSLHLTTGASPKLTINANGRVGIGTTTPAANLEIKSGTGTEIKLVDTNGFSNQISMERSSINSYNSIRFRTAGITDWWLDGSIPGSRNFGLLKSGGGNYSLLAHYSRNNIGINTNNPDSTFSLDVNGGLRNGIVSKGSVSGVSGTCDSNGKIIVIIPALTAGVTGNTNGTSLTSGVMGTAFTTGSTATAAGVTGWGSNGATGVRALATSSSSAALEVAGSVKVGGTTSTRFAQTLTQTINSTQLAIPTSMSNSPNDIILVTHNFVSQYIGALGVYWNGSNWVVYTEALTNINIGEKINVIVIKQ
jgi:hypothetical protein